MVYVGWMRNQPTLNNFLLKTKNRSAFFLNLVTAGADGAAPSPAIKILNVFESSLVSFYAHLIIAVY